MNSVLGPFDDARSASRGSLKPPAHGHAFARAHAAEPPAKRRKGGSETGSVSAAAQRLKTLDDDRSASNPFRGWEVNDDDFVPESASVIDVAAAAAAGAGGVAVPGADLSVTERELREAHEGGPETCLCCKARFGATIPVKDENRAKEYRLFLDLMMTGFPLRNIAEQVARFHNAKVHSKNVRNGKPSSEWTPGIVLRHIEHHILDERITHITFLRTLRTHTRQMSDLVYTKDGVTGRLKVNNNVFRNMILGMKQAGQEHRALTSLLENQRR